MALPKLPGRDAGVAVGGWRRSRAGLTASSWTPALATAGLYALFLALRLNQPGMDLSRFVTAGDRFASPAREFGIELDSPMYRHQRILYPVLVRAVSGGDPEAALLWMVGVNFAALCLLGWIGGLLARSAGASALWGLVFPLLGLVGVGRGRATDARDRSGDVPLYVGVVPILTYAGWQGLLAVNWEPSVAPPRSPRRLAEVFFILAFTVTVFGHLGKGRGGRSRKAVLGVVRRAGLPPDPGGVGGGLGVYAGPLRVLRAGRAHPVASGAGAGEAGAGGGQRAVGLPLPVAPDGQALMRGHLHDRL